MSDPLEPLWTVTMISPKPGVLNPSKPILINAHMCNAQDDGTLIFIDSRGHDKAIIAAGQWQMVEREAKRE